MTREFYKQEYHKQFTEDKIAKRPYASMYEKKKEDVLAFLRERENGIILDIGCGPGRITTPLAHINTKLIIGMDISEKMIAEAKKSLEGARNPQNVHFVVADAEYLPFRSNSINSVISLDVIPHLESPFEHIKEMKRITNNGGYLLFDFSNRNPLWMVGYPKFMIENIYLHLRKRKMMNFLLSGCVTFDSQHRVTHYFRKRIDRYLSQLNLINVLCKKYGLFLAPKVYLFFVKK